MTTTTIPKLLTADELLRLHSQGVKGELIKGVLHKTMPAGLKHGEIVAALMALLWIYVHPRQLGRVFGSDTGVQLEWNLDTVREPDIAFVSAARLPLDAEITGYCPVVPDLVVEVASPSDTRPALDSKVAVNAKAAMWLDYGARMVIVIHPQTRRIQIRQPNQPTLLLTDGDTLDGGSVLPGFQCPVTDILGR